MAGEPRHLINLLRDWSHHPVNPTAFETLIPSCDCEFWASWNLSEKELTIFCLGILVGLILLPVLELLLVLRQAWSIWVRTKVLGSGTRLYRAV